MANGTDTHEPLWRDEFAVDAARERYVSRRQFGKFLGLTSLAMFAGQVWILAKSWFAATPAFPEAPVAHAEEVPVGGVKLFSYPGPHDPCILVHPEAGRFVAYSQKCTHLACAVRPRVDEGIIHCPCHEGIFDLASGRPLAGPPRRPLPLVHIDVRGGQIYATGVEERTV
jgi:Rieske Fe-S protein